MFGFLNTTVLFAATAALIPLIIHLFSRRKVKVVEFSSLRHLKEMQKRQLRRLRIRQLLLLLLRMLIILVVVMAFARPTSREGAVGSHASVSAVILLDNSASMNRYVADGNLFELARKRTAELLGTFSQSDEICLLPLDYSVSQDAGGFSTAALAQEQLTRLQVGTSQADLQGKLEKVRQLLEGATNLNREIYIVSDRQRATLPESEPLHDCDARLYIVDLPLEENDNLGIVSLDFGGQLIQPGHDFHLVTTIRNYGTGDSSQRIASLYVNGKRVAQTDFSVPGGSETTVRFARSVSRTGFHSGFVELSDDKFPGDNRYYFSFRIPEQFNVLIINGDNATRFVSMALVPDASGGRQYWSIKEALPRELAGVSFRDYSVVMLIGAPALDDTYIARLKSFVRRGRALFVSYAGETDIDYFNTVWSEVTGVIYEQPVRKNFSRTGFYTLETLDFDHPIFTVFDLEDSRLPEIKFFTLPKMNVTNGASVLAGFSGGHPALVESVWGNGKVLTFTGPMAPAYTDLASHGFFVPFIARVSEYLASDLSSLDLHLFAGENISRALPLTGSITYPVELTMPDSTIVSIPPEEDKARLIVRTGPAPQAGVYRISYRGSELDRFAVNINPSECDLSRIDVDQFATALGKADARELQVAAPLQTVISGFRIGRELWQLFLWVAVILIAVEMLLGRGSGSED